MSWEVEGLRVAFTGKHPADGIPLRIVASVDGYRALPPAWIFEDPEGKRSLFPKAGHSAGVSSIFHSNRLICAPFNRLAYSQLGGPHSNWGGPECWLQVRRHVRATNLAGMLAVVLGHLKASLGVY